MPDDPNDNIDSSTAGDESPAADASSATSAADAAGKVIDLTQHDPAPKKTDETGAPAVPLIEVRARDPQEEVRGDLARGLLWLLTLTIGGMLLFVGTGKIESEVLTQSIFPSLVTLTGTALGFYFGAQSSKGKDNSGK